MNDIKTPGEGWRPSREEVARIIDPGALVTAEQHAAEIADIRSRAGDRSWGASIESQALYRFNSYQARREAALSKADAILALSLSPLLVEGKENKELGAARTHLDVSNGHQDAEPSGASGPHPDTSWLPCAYRGSLAMEAEEALLNRVGPLPFGTRNDQCWRGGHLLHRCTDIKTGSWVVMQNSGNSYQRSTLIDATVFS